MKIISTNVGNPTSITWKGEQQETGIYKYPTNNHINLEKENVLNDTVSDRRYHGGIYMACYLFSADYYPYWKNKYPYLSWDWGMFGENLTVEGLDESLIKVGSTYKIGTAYVKVTQPREPCFKLGIRFENQDILPEFVAHNHPGLYLQVLESGIVKAGDSMELYEEAVNGFSIQEFYELLYRKHKDNTILKSALASKDVSLVKKNQLKQLYKRIL